MNKLAGGIADRIKTAGEKGISMQLKLFIFLLVLVLTMVAGIFAILLITGTFTVGLTQSEKLLNGELKHMSQEAEKQFGQISVQTVELSNDLSRGFEKALGEKEFSTSQLNSHPEVLEQVLESQYERLLFHLYRSKSSGVFVILNSTINDKAENAKNSRAGLYIKNMEPNILSSSSPTILMLRGYPNIGRKNSVPLHSQWAMEFDITDALYYSEPVKAAKQGEQSLSRLYYWSNAIKLPSTSEEVMLCSVPLINAAGDVYGVCGFEVSAMLFKLSFTPDTSTYNRLFCCLSHINDKQLFTCDGMFAGGYNAKSDYAANSCLNIKHQKGLFYSYQKQDNTKFIGMHTPVKLYPTGSVFENQKWAVSLMMPYDDITSSIYELQIKLIALCGMLIVVGIILSSFLSRHYIKPISQGLDFIKAENYNDRHKTRVLEIDDLIEFLTMRREGGTAITTPSNNNQLDYALFDEFVNNTKLLSPAERAVFDLYVDGYTAKDITQILCLSINTIKTHNKRIYMKLNVASREELLLYVNMLKQKGTSFEKL